MREKEREREQDHPRYPYRVQTGRFEPWQVRFTKVEPRHTSSSATGVRTFLSRVASLTHWRQDLHPAPYTDGGGGQGEASHTDSSTTRVRTPLSCGHRRQDRAPLTRATPTVSDPATGSATGVRTNSGASGASITSSTTGPPSGSLSCGATDPDRVCRARAKRDQFQRV